KAVMIKNPNMSVKITSDREIRDVFVGSTSRAARGDGEIVYNNLEDLMKEVGSLPAEPSYLYYTITWPALGRCSIYLDPDRPAKIVIEGKQDWVDQVESDIKKEFVKGDSRYLVHQRGGIFLIWLMVIVIAILGLMITSIIRGEVNPLMILVVLVMSGILGTYMSLLKAKEIQPANTISLKGRKRPRLESLMHIITIALGIISAILATIIVEFALD
ncbi:MAG: hypothetical protein ACMUIG_09960, partial [Thermoplasmatota archaeon]